MGQSEKMEESKNSFLGGLHLSEDGSLSGSSTNQGPFDIGDCGTGKGKAQVCKIGQTVSGAAYDDDG